MEHVGMGMELFWEFVLGQKIVQKELIHVYRVYRDLIVYKGMVDLKNRVKLHLKFVIDVIKARKSRKEIITLKEHISDSKYN